MPELSIERVRKIHPAWKITRYVDIRRGAYWEAYQTPTRQLRFPDLETLHRLLTLLDTDTDFDYDF